MHTLLDPEMPISAKASSIHHITNKKVEHEPTIEEFIEHMLGGQIQGPCTLVAHNAPFDKRFFAELFEDELITIDTLRIARKLWPDFESHQLQVLVYELGFETGEAHSAMGDVEGLMNLLRIVANEQDWNLIDMYENQVKPPLEKICRFGKKHYGTPWKDVDKGYLEWILENVKDLAPDTRYTVEHYLKK